MKTNKIFFSLLLVFLAACSSTTESKLPNLATVTAEITSTPSVASTGTHVPTKRATTTRRPTYTYTPTLPVTPSPTTTLTKTTIFNAASIQTITPAPAAKCPSSFSGTVPKPNFVNSNERVEPADLMDDVLDFLNHYGADALYAEHQKTNGIYWDLNISDYLDLTNDGVKELVANKGGHLYIIGCRDEHYAVMDTRQADAGMSFPVILDVTDANRNGMPEGILYLGSYTSMGSFYQVIEWNGHKFQDLLVPLEKENEDYSHDDLYIEGGTGSKLDHEDFDQDSVEEYIATFGIPEGEMYVYHIPWREEKQIYKWNGQQFVPYRRIFTAPQYRFQAVQDGDRATIEGEYDKALDFYQQAIFNDKLEWWSPDRFGFLQKVFLISFQKLNDSTPVPPAPDPEEYDNLAAYARYRIMLLHLARGWVTDARIVYDTLQKKYPEGKTGHDYAALAETVWTEFENSKDLGKACEEAVKYASARPEEMYYYIGGSGNPGYHGIDYNLHPELVCPFH